MLNSGLRSQGERAALTDDSIERNTPDQIALGETLYRTIGTDGGVAVSASDVDLFRFVAPSTGRVTFTAAAPGEAATDPYLRLFDAEGNELASNDDAAADTPRRPADVRRHRRADVLRRRQRQRRGRPRLRRPHRRRRAAGNGGDYVLEASPLAAADEVSLEFDARQAATYLDASGDVVTVSIRGARRGRVTFAGDATSGDPTGIVVDGSDFGSTLTVKTRGGAATSVGGISAGGGLKALSAKTTSVAGDVTAGSVAKLQLANLSGGTMTIGGGGAPVALTLASATDYGISSASIVKSLKVGQWTDSDATRDVIAADLIGSISVAGDLGADVTARTIGKAKVGGALAGSDVRAADAIGAFTVGSARDSRVFAGVFAEVTGLPASVDDFDNDFATIKSFAVKGRSGATFSNTLVAAPVVGKATLGSVVAANGGTAFGLATDFTRSATGATDAGGPFRLSNLEDPGEDAAAGDFRVRTL